MWSIAGVARAGDTIPEPDAILHGQVCLPGGPAADTDDVSVVARTMVSGQMVDVGTYKMGDQPSASDCLGSADCYVLRMRVETVPQGTDPSGSSVVLSPTTPATVELFVREGSAPETPAGTIQVDERGMIRQRSLYGAAETSDINGDGHENLADHALLEQALGGPATPTTQPCDPKDINRDGYIDLRDYARLQADLS
jgi:hypothetical protein